MQFLSKLNYESYPSLVQDAVSLIETSFAYLYGIDDLADQMEVSKHHLIRVFSDAAGVSPGQYLIQVRIFHAKSMLQSGQDTPLEIIAGACGYSNANYFCKAFKKQTGQTPSEYAKSFREDPDGMQTDLFPQKLYL